MQKRLTIICIADMTDLKFKIHCVLIESIGWQHSYSVLNNVFVNNKHI